MSGKTQSTTIGQLPTPSSGDTQVSALLTRLVWALWVVSLGAAVQFWRTGGWELDGVVTIDGLTVVLWVTVTFFSGIVHSYSRRYMAGNKTINRFFGFVFTFTLVVMALVALDHIVLFGMAWLAMGLVMAELIGHANDWPQARDAASVARRSFLTSSAFLAIALGLLYRETGITALSELNSAVEAAPTGVVVVAASAVLLAAMVQSALVPFHTWLLSSMTAPTPASALMHAGFVNAGGVLLVRFAPVVTVEPAVMLVIVVVGAVSALAGKLLKSVQTDIKTKLGCSTVGQMGFMIMQAGLGFFSAAIAHLILHGFYKAYQFLSAGSQVAHESPTTEHSRSLDALGVVVILATGVAGGVVFAALTGKGTKPDTGLLLTLLVVVTVMHAAREIVTQTAVPATVRYGAVPVIALPAIAVYAGVYQVIATLLVDLPAVGNPQELTVLHGLVAVAFLGAYVVIETGVYKRSKRLYVLVLNVSQPATETLLTSTEEYNEY
jgi:NAD(P)H-quinone oxidoreductase subunit 5